MMTSDTSFPSTRLLRLMTLAVILPLCTHLWAQKDSSIYEVVDAFPETQISPNHIRYDTREIREDVNAIAIGQVNVLDTYLSPAEYTGTELRYISHSTRRIPGGNPISRQLVQQGSIAGLEDRVGKGSEISGLYDLSFALHYNWVPFANCLLQVGGQFETGLGVIYNTRNTNNPAQMRLFANIGPSAVGQYAFQVFHKRCKVRYEVSVPLVGVMFSPNYGQSYYEIFSLGNYDHNCVLTTVSNAPSLRHMLSFDVAFRSFILRVGYLGDYQQAKVNNLKQHVNTNAFMIGFVKNLSIMKKRKLKIEDSNL